MSIVRDTQTKIQVVSEMQARQLVILNLDTIGSVRKVPFRKTWQFRTFWRDGDIIV